MSAHFKHRPDAFAAWVQVRAERLDSDLLLAALKAGHFYSSTGPEIHEIAVDGAELRIACSPASSVFVSGKGSIGRSCHGDGLTECRVPLERFADSYARVTVVDAAGKRAWSNPIWFDDLGAR